MIAASRVYGVKLGSILQFRTFEGIKKARIADYAYLCVPEGAIEPHELAEGWGLLWVDSRMEVTVVVPAENLNCLVGNRIHLAQNIALACRNDVMFANGLRERDEKVEFLRLPKRRRKQADFYPEG